MTMEPYENNELGVFDQPGGDEPFEGSGEGEALPNQDNGVPAAEPPADQAEETQPEAAEASAVEPPAEPAPKKKRAARKKAEKPAETPEEQPEPPLPEDGGEIQGAAPVPSDDDLDAPAENAGPAAGQNILVMGLAEDQEASEEAGPVDNGPEVEAGSEVPTEPPETGIAPAHREQRAARPRENRPVSSRTPLTSLNLNELDRNLSREEQQEWNDIYASFRSKSVLTGRIIGVDPHAFYVRSKETGALERRRMYCAVVIAYRVKVLIPETEFWMPGEERPSHVFRNMTGAEIDYTILDVDREGGVAIASRRMGAASRRHFFGTARGGHSPGERQTCRVLAVGPTRCLLECGGYDITLGRRDMSYSSIYDLREKFKRGQVLDCIVTSYDRVADKLEISVREAEPHPFQGITSRHPIGCRRQAVISGKYGGGVFCTLPDGTTCLCLYTAQHADRDFHIGDTILLVIVQYDHERSLVYGRILSKW